jgi:hypothetical protein
MRLATDVLRDPDQQVGFRLPGQLLPQVVDQHLA